MEKKIEISKKKKNIQKSMPSLKYFWNKIFRI